LGTNNGDWDWVPSQLECGLRKRQKLLSKSLNRTNNFDAFTTSKTTFLTQNWAAGSN